jgi:hypothetical protein
MVGRWTHSMCKSCWFIYYPRSTPTAIKEQYRISEKCCYCGTENKDGIYIRGNPDELLCKGNHREEY